MTKKRKSVEVSEAEAAPTDVFNFMNKLKAPAELNSTRSQDLNQDMVQLVMICITRSMM